MPIDMPSNAVTTTSVRNKAGSVQGPEVKYELHSLGWKSFQDLCSTIAGEILGQTVQVFLPSKDAGRDGAFHGSWKPSPNEEMAGSFVVQCKFTGKADAQLTVGTVADEFAKAAAQIGRAHV